MFLLACLWGAFHMNGLLNVPTAAYVKPEDLEAVNWIKQNTPEDACFMINTYRFEFSTNFIIGSDAGGWLPVLAQRCVVTYPMTSNIERFDHPNALEKVVRIHALRGELSSSNTIEILKKYDVSYVYVKQDENQNSMINYLESGYYELLFNFDNVYIYFLK
jgi:uncharacterized membrane protein